jgi:hypothetical protein
MTEPRYYTHEMSYGRRTVAVSVLDRAYCHEERARYVSNGPLMPEQARLLAGEECARLNALEAEGVAA